MKKKITFIKYYYKNYILKHKIKYSGGIREYLNKKQRKYAGISISNSKEFNIEIANKINSGKPFMVSRFGAFELINIRNYYFDIKSKQEGGFKYLCNNAGFFPKNSELGKEFTSLMIDSLKSIDAMGIWFLQQEDYYIEQYMSSDLDIAYLLDIEPWSCKEQPWSSALEGKKVLVIHPFENTIQSQYLKRSEIFPGTDILPKFQLKTLKAVQTIAGRSDDRFETWFEALEYMYSEAIKVDFDIAIVGCGAYGLPLAAKLKQYGKQVIHLGGATQLLFGIKGKRWEENEEFKYVSKYFNSSWVYPKKEDTPNNSNKVESGCYWK